MTLTFAESTLFVEFSRGETMLQVLGDPVVMRVADQVVYRAAAAPAAFCYSTRAAALGSAAASDTFRRVLARFGAEPQAVAPRVDSPQEWQRTSDVLIGLELATAATPPANGLHLIAAHTPVAMQKICDTLLTMQLPFALGTLPEHLGWFAFARVDLRGSGAAFVREHLDQMADTAVLTEVWVNTDPHVEFFVDWRCSHPAAPALQALCECRPDMFADWELIACGPDAPLRLTWQPDALLQYPRAARLEPPRHVTQTRASTCQGSQAVVERLRQSGRHSIELRIIADKAAGQTRTRSRGHLETEATELRTRILRANMRLAEIHHALGNMPVAYARPGGDDAALHTLLRQLPLSLVRSLTLAVVANPAGNPGASNPSADNPGTGNPRTGNSATGNPGADTSDTWLVLLARDPTEQIQLPRRLLSGWIRCIGHGTRADEPPMVYLPENYAFYPDLAMLNPADVEAILDRDGHRDTARRVLVPRISAEQPTWDLLVIPEATCTPLAERAYAVEQHLWQPWLAPTSAVPNGKPTPEPALDRFESQFTAQVSARMAEISQHIATIRQRADNLVTALSRHETSLGKLEDFDRRMARGADLSEVLSGLVTVLESFASTHQGLTQTSREALQAYQAWKQETDRAESALTALREADESPQGSAT